MIDAIVHGPLTKRQQEQRITALLLRLDRVVREEARRFCSEHPHAVTHELCGGTFHKRREDVEQECRLILIENADEIMAADSDEAKARLRLRARLIDRLVRAQPEEERNGTTSSFEEMAEALDAAGDENAEVVTVDAGDASVLSTPSHEDACLHRVAVHQLREVLAPLLDKDATAEALRKRRARIIPDVRLLLGAA